MYNIVHVFAMCQHCTQGFIHSEFLSCSILLRMKNNVYIVYVGLWTVDCGLWTVDCVFELYLYDYNWYNYVHVCFDLSRAVCY